MYHMYVWCQKQTQRLLLISISKYKMNYQYKILVTLTFLFLFLIPQSTPIPHTCSQLLLTLKSLPQNSPQLPSLITQPLTQQCTNLTLTPYYKWSQNMSHIQVKIYFPASSQSTTCDKLVYVNRTVQHNGFHVQTYCINQGDYFVKYQIGVRTYKSLDFVMAQWKIGGQNSIILQCMKSPAPYFWPILHSREIIPKRMPRVWWEMLSIYGQQLRQVIDLLQIGDNDVQISKNVKNKRRKNTEIKRKAAPYYCNKGSPEYLGSWL